MKAHWKTLALASALMGAACPALAAPRPAITGVSHIAIYSADPARTEAFYVHDLGATKGSDPENPLGARYYFSPGQFVESLPLPAGAGADRLDHIAFTTPDAAGLRGWFETQKITPGALMRGSDGSQWFDVSDPEGNRVEFVQYPAQLPDVPNDPLSDHIIHVGLIVHDAAKEDRFYRTLLGFRPYWHGGFDDHKDDWISQQVPDGGDWIEYMIQPGTGPIPAGMSQQTAGVLNHFSLGVANIEATYTTLWNGDRLKGQDPNTVPKIGRDAKWQLNLIDPDGTRAEIMEFHAIGTPCCSPFTAPDPVK
ncbi:VOC family protein [Asticcacaulis sp. EMRT-3]|uniref:VOC family protein n=1 Tax=Asticcacaulis sp. EMRT-3 TaxID=3040349 RepID=UPI0024AEDE3C|nr:VOC family protein [Asticcacaulis sp. EMRT-3]MDI7776162.1 VOC family protein [Asticcacaulis sp. EMRT-3]